MLAKTFASYVKITNRLSNPSSLTSLYRSIELGNTQIRCCSEFGNFVIDIEPTGLSEACLLNTQDVVGVATSLLGDEEIRFTKKDNQVRWKCGKASGHWNLVNQDHQIPKILHDKFPWEPPVDFSDALLLASSACQAAAVSIGLYGIVIEPTNDSLRLISSNTIALASASVAKDGYPYSTKITLCPPVPVILAILLNTFVECKLDITGTGLFVQGDGLTAQLPIGEPLEHDLGQIADNFQKEEHTAKVNSASIKKFLSRARSLADRNVSFTVGLKVEEGKLILEHKSIASGSEEYFLAEGLEDTVSYKSVQLPADMLFIPLQATDTAVFDYLADGRLILKGLKPEFIYIVGGQ